MKDPQEKVASREDQVVTHEVLNKGFLAHVAELKKQNDEPRKQVEELTRRLNENG